MLEGNPPDTEQWQPAIDHHRQQFGKPPQQASADRGVYSSENETSYAIEQGVKRVILPQHGEDGFDKWIGRGVIANNLTVMGKTLAAKTV